MPLLQPNLSLKLSQRQILTPGLVQMVTVLALNRMELKEMINAELVENPVLEELETTVPLLDQVAEREEARERHESPAVEPDAPASEPEDAFDQIDFGSYFREYLDPGYRCLSEIESVERPSFENFLSRPATLTDHLTWQLGSIHLNAVERAAAELVIGNLNEEGYLTASEEELLAVRQPGPEEGAGGGSVVSAPAESTDAREPGAASPATPEAAFPGPKTSPAELSEGPPSAERFAESVTVPSGLTDGQGIERDAVEGKNEAAAASSSPPANSQFSREVLRRAITLVQQMDPPGVAARDLSECLRLQLQHHQQVAAPKSNGTELEGSPMVQDCFAIVAGFLPLLQKKEFKEIGKALGRPISAIEQAVEFIRTLDPRPGLRYNKEEARVIEPDVAFVKQGDAYLVIMNEEEVPQLRLSPTYKRLMARGAAEKEVRNYVKERYKSALQLIKNIEQRKHTIARVCYSIIERQRDFLDHGVDRMKPMMIKEVAEEIGVHPSTVSRAVSNKYVHTPQGVFELRYFFSESVNGPEGLSTSLLILKRRVKKIIEEEDPQRPLTDEQITRILLSQGIRVTRRTVAKYREDMRIPSTHQRKIKN